MLLKSTDSKEEQVANLEQKLKVARGDRRSWIEKELRNLRAGIKAENDVAYLINFDYEKSPNWAVIHDLRLEVGGRVAQIDHLLINRFLDVYVLETKSFHSGLKINEDGEFLRWNDYAKKYEGMASPLAQNERHIAVLRDAFQAIKLPSKLGVTITPTFHSFVLISANARVDRPKNFDASKVIKADSLKATIDKQFDNLGIIGAVGSLARLIDEGTLYAISRRLGGQHKPLHPVPEADEAGLLVGNSTSEGTGPMAAIASPIGSGPLSTTEQTSSSAPSPRTAPSKGSGPLLQAATIDPALTPSCKSCGKGKGSILHGQYGYYFKCSDCGTNTSMKWDCGAIGHSPRVRKEGPNFYRECQGCGIGSLFHVNPEA